MANKSVEDPKKPLKSIRPRITLFRFDPFKKQGENVYESTKNLKTLLSNVFSLGQSFNDSAENRCPHCNAAMYAIKPLDSDSDNAFAVFKCSNCDFEAHIVYDPVELETKSKTSKATAKILNLIAVSIASICAVYAVLTGNKLTLLGGIFIAISFFLQSLLFSYKAWQYQTRRLYERKPPLRDWFLSFFKK